MSGSQDLIQIIDATLTKSEIREVIAALQPLKEEIKNFSSISLFTRNTTGGAEFRQQAQQLTEAFSRIKKLETELEAIRNSNATKQKARTDQEIANSQKQAEATRTRVREIRAEEDAYKKLANEYSKTAAEAKKLAAQYGVNSKEARAAIASADTYGKKLKEIDGSIGQHSRNVGNYKEGIKSFAKELLNVGLAFFGFQQSVEFLRDSVNEFNKAELAATRLKNIISNLGRSGDIGFINQQIKELGERFKTIQPDELTDVFQRLYTYGKLSTNQMKELLPVIINFASKQGIDLAEATGVVTKALEGNAKALKEYGINVKDGSNVTERFGILMTELKPRVEGAADAFGETLAGQIKKTSVEVEELKQAIGEDLQPVVKGFLSFLNASIGGLRIFGDYISQIVTTIKNGGDILQSLGTNPDELRQQAEDQERVAKKMAEYYLEGDKFKTKDLKDQQKLLQVYKDQLAIQERKYHLLVNNPTTSGTPVADVQKQKMLTSRFLVDIASQAISGNAPVNSDADPNDDGKKDKADPNYALNIAIKIQKSIADSVNATTAARLAAYFELKRLQDLEDLNAEQKFDRDVENIGRLAKIKYDAAHQDIEIQAQADKDFAEADKKRLEDAEKRRKDASDKKEKQDKEESERIHKQQMKVKDEDDKKKKEATDAQIKQQQRLHELEKEAAEELVHLGESVVEGFYERQLNSIQSQIDENNKLYEQETRNIENSSLSAQEKAARQISLDAQVKASNEELARQQRDIKVKDAKFDRDVSLAKVIWNTAQAVMKDTAGVPWPASLVVAGMDIALGAVQAAAILAKPIPMYAEGTDYKPTSGPMIVGEKGSELMITPDGKMSLTPGIPSLVYGERGTQVIPAAETSDMINGAIMSRVFQAGQQADQKIEIRTEKTEALLTAILEVNQMQIRALKQRQQIHIKSDYNPAFWERIKNAL